MISSALVRSVAWVVALNGAALHEASAQPPAKDALSCASVGAAEGPGGPCRVSGGTLVFTDRAAFIAALADGYIENGLDDVPPGPGAGFRYTDSQGFDYVLFTQFFADGGTYNGKGFISTDRVDDQIAVSILRGSIAVTAFGANMWTVDFHQRPIAGTLEISIDGSLVETLESGDTRTFRGFITPVEFGQLTMHAPRASGSPETSPDRWPAVDNLILGRPR